MKSLPSPAGGGVQRVWFSASGRLYIHTELEKTFYSDDLERWSGATAEAVAPAQDPVETLTRPAPTVKLRAQKRRSATLYAFDLDAWRSDDEGLSWVNLTSHKGRSLLGGRINDLAVSPENDQFIAVAASTGVWTSHDGGLTWRGLNESLPNLPVQRILRTPAGARGVLVLAGSGDTPDVFEWMPGQKAGWLPSEDDLSSVLQERRLRESLTNPPAGDLIRVWQATDDARVLLALAEREGAPAVYRSLNGGNSWDDLTANLPAARAHAIVGDVASGGIYVATDAGLFVTRGDLRAPAQPTPWQRVRGAMPDAAVVDVRLDPNANQLYSAVEGFGIYATLAPHRAWSPAVVHAADYAVRPAAPGALLSVLGARVQSATAGRWTAPVLSANSTESQIQVPFEVQGDRVALTLGAPNGPVRVDLPVQSAAPAILIDRDGSPMLLEADTGLPVDAVRPGLAGSRIQILASGMGRVTPEWPTGLPAPLEGSPRVLAPVRAFLDRTPIEVSRAILAPGYIGYYLIEVVLPEFVNAGAGEIYIETGGRVSNRARIFLAR